ncbi:MAG: hypothetical protein KA368_24275 [Acidobacteria bacterium]|nr:hypothetical protein [Acidobacteriota bacterium]
MSINPRKRIPKKSAFRHESGFLGSLRAAALIMALTGAIGSFGFMLRVGSHNESNLLVLMFAVWVLSPFVALILANVVSRHWAVPTRAMLYSLMIVLALVSLTLYGDVALGPPRPQPAFRFLVVPGASWLLIAVAMTIAALLSGKTSPKGDNA